MFKSLISVFITAGIVISGNAFAVEVTELNKSAVQVADRSIKVKNLALQQALQNVVIKNTGSMDALSQPAIKNALSHPTAYIRQFGYQELDGQQYLQASFDQRKVIRLLREAQLPVWGKQRPLTLMWLAMEQQGQRELLNDASEQAGRLTIEQLSKSRGVPMLLPMMDLDDSMNVSVNDVRGMFADQVAIASQRYRSDYFAMVSIDPVGDGSLSYRLALFPADVEQPLFNPLVQRSAEVESVDVAIDEIFKAISEYYVGRYAIADSGEANRTQLTFVEITDRKQLVDIEQYLAQLSAVKHVSLTQLKGISAQFTLELFGNEEDLYRLLSLESKIQGLEKSDINSAVDPLSPSQSHALEYIWQGR